MSYCIFDEATCEDLLASFSQFIAPNERDLMKSILDGDVEDFCSEEVLDSLEQFKCRSLMTKDNSKVVRGACKTRANPKTTSYGLLLEKHVISPEKSHSK